MTLHAHPTAHPIAHHADNPLASRALADVLAERLAQVHQRGHTSAADGAHPPERLLDLTFTYARIAADRAQPGTRQHLAGARKKAVQAAALAIAAVERLDAEIQLLDLTPAPAAEGDLFREPTLFNTDHLNNGSSLA